MTTLLAASVAPAQINGTVVPIQQQAYGRNGGFDQQAQAQAAPVQASAPSIAPTAPPPNISAVPAQAAQIGQQVQTEGANRATTGVNEVPVATPTGERLAPSSPGEYERYVTQVLGREVPRFGASLLLPSARNFTPPPTAAVPPDYRLNPGDEILLGLTGSVESELRLTLDNSGAVFIPRVGRVSLAGVRNGDLASALSRRISEEYRDYRIAVSVTQLHGIRVYVTGFAANPGAYTVSSLSTLVNAVLAGGGPTAGGSFRSIQVRRAGRIISDFDLYDLLLRGDKSKDIVLENEDVIFITPVGPQVAVTGSVNAEAIYEARPGESVGQVLAYAGGLSTLADPSRTIVSRLSELDRNGWVQLNLADANQTAVAGGDILRLLSVADYARPLERQNILVTIEGEVDKPGHFYLPPNATMADALAAAGGLTRRAFVYGVEFDRARVQQEQQRSFDEALQQLELSLAAAPLANTALDSSDAVVRAQQLAAARAVVDRLRAARPDGRVVLEVQPDSTALPLTTVLENNDRLYIPPEPTTIGVFGAVYRPGSFQINRARRVSDYLDLAGGSQRVADRREIFVVRANGAVITRRHGGLNQRALPGDVVFVPVKTQGSTFWAHARDVAGLLIGAGLSAAAVISLTR
ncbi:SLBB domain-containing protein [uncultured Sphingomonas sp.]|uniref:polysaccharide biosynthesis/export family protein n=1 Tax=uncultured Sphingomonas sp. TaxID=158754 RepID=UPI0035CB1D65